MNKITYNSLRFIFEFQTIFFSDRQGQLDKPGTYRTGGENEE